MNFKTLESNSEQETKEIAETVAKRLHGGDVIGLQGDLGSGKTTFVQGLASGLHLKEGYVVASPTFTWMHEYPCEKFMLYHIDFYRLENRADVYSLGLERCFDKNSIVVVEWFEKARDVLPENIFEIHFQWKDFQSRTITMNCHSEPKACHSERE